MTVQVSPSKKDSVALLALLVPAATVADQVCTGCVPQVMLPVKVCAAGRPLLPRPEMFLVIVTGERVLEICRLTKL